MKIVPMTVRRANEFVEQHHRHNRPVTGARYALGCDVAGELVGVAIVGRPVARMIDFTKTAELTRLCVTPKAPKNACSFLYAACRRVWFAMGGEKMITYTLARESGSSLRGAGWRPVGEVKGAQWTRESRPREEQGVFDEVKIRWETTP